MVTVEELPTWLLERIPGIREIYESDELDWGREPPISPYFMLGFVLKPHVLELIERNDLPELKRIFDLLEYLANEGDASVKNELRVVTEEDLALWQFWGLLGDTTRRNHIAGLLWFPERRDRDTRINTHVDEDKYRRRWFEEIEKVGGFEKLTDDLHVSIRNRLGEEFEIEAAYVPRRE